MTDSRQSDAHPAPIARDGIKRLEREGRLGPPGQSVVGRLPRGRGMTGVRDFDLTPENLLAWVRGELPQLPMLRIELCDPNGTILAEYQQVLRPGECTMVQAAPDLDPLIDSRSGDLIDNPLNVLRARAQLVMP